ncbi:hypothetical protein AWG48_22205 [Escherichia coli]|nr:hypothetical protein AWG48_22205 [Escherichia coli]
MVQFHAVLTGFRFFADGVIEWNEPEVVRALRGALKYDLRTPNRQQRNGSPLKPHEIAPTAS